MVFNDRSLLNTVTPPGCSITDVSMVFNDRSLLNFSTEVCGAGMRRFNGLQ